MRLLFRLPEIKNAKFEVGLYTFFAVVVDKCQYALYSSSVHFAVGVMPKEVILC